MDDPKKSALRLFEDKFKTYVEIRSQEGEQAALEALFEGYPERQKNYFKHFVEGRTLAQGFEKAIPEYKRIGMDMTAVDVSTPTVDAVLEIQRICPVKAMSAQYGVEPPCPIICELDIAATHAAYPEIQGKILSRIAGGDCVCIFKYERTR